MVVWDGLSDLGFLDLLVVHGGSGFEIKALNFC
jgi:hypothetical protein